MYIYGSNGHFPGQPGLASCPLVSSHYITLLW